MSNKVGWSIRTTINLGNYESLTIGMNAEVEALPDETTKQLSDRTYEFVEAEFNRRVANIKKDIQNSRG